MLAAAKGTTASALAAILIQVVNEGGDTAEDARNLLSVVYHRHPESLSGLPGTDSVLLSISKVCNLEYSAYIRYSLGERRKFKLQVLHMV